MSPVAHLSIESGDATDDVDINLGYLTVKFSFMVMFPPGATTNLSPVPGTAPHKILDERIFQYAKGGYRVVHRDDNSVQLLRPKTFSFLWALVWFFIGLGTGFFLYLFYYLAKKDKIVYIEVADSGLMREAPSGGVSVLGWILLSVMFLFFLSVTLLLLFPFFWIPLVL